MAASVFARFKWCDRYVSQASGDLDLDVWTKWCSEAFDPNTSPAALRATGGDRFASIDLKLAQAFWQVIANAGEVPTPVKSEIRAMELEPNQNQNIDNLARNDPGGTTS